MTARVFVNADRSKIVPEGSTQAAFAIHVKEARKLGLVSAKAADEAEKSGDPSPEAAANTAKALTTKGRK
ncbi:MAG: hypothetical protein ABIR11_07110 [Candidatus Limnocylindrales bacterium]